MVLVLFVLVRLYNTFQINKQYIAIDYIIVSHIYFTQIGI